MISPEPSVPASSAPDGLVAPPPLAAGASRDARASRGLLHRYVRDLVYGANDGIITTFAVVAGVSGASLAPRIVLILGVANLVADGISMGASNYLGIRSERDAHQALHGVPAHDVAVHETSAFMHGLATFLAFVVAGAVPLVAYLAPIQGADRFAWACVLTLSAQFAVGAARTVVTRQRWWTSGLEMLLVGAAAAAVAWGAGRFVGRLAGPAGL